MTSQKAKILIACVDALVSTLTVVLVFAIKDPALSAAVIPLLASYQAIAVALIMSLTITEVAEIRAVSEERTARIYREE